MKNWITIQLSEKGEMVLENEPKIIEEILNRFITSEYFFPVYFNRSKAYGNKIFLFRGYIFVEYKKEDFKNYPKLSNNQYFVGPLLSGRKLHLTSNNEIEKLKKELAMLTQPNINIGDEVKVIDGKYKNLTATVTEYYPDLKEADLKVHLKCMNIIVPRIPTACLASLNKNKDKPKENSTLHTKIIKLLKSFPKGLARKEIISKIDLTEKEIKRVSTSLSRALKKDIIKCLINENNRSIFYL